MELGHGDEAASRAASARDGQLPLDLAAPMDDVTEVVKRSRKPAKSKRGKRPEAARGEPDASGDRKGGARKAIEAPRRSAAELARQARDISVSEFFAKNRHLLGFDNPSKALLTTVK